MAKTPKGPFRSAITGKYVSKGTAIRHPKTTVAEPLRKR